MITRINAKAETALREALGSVARLENLQIESALAGLDDRERAEALGLAVVITGYVVVDVCGNQWPNQASVRRIADDLATTGTIAKGFPLHAGQIYEYLSRTVLGSERIEDVIPDEPEFMRLPVIVAEQALAVYCPKELEIWEYLDRIESAIETASALDPAALPAAVLRAHLPAPDA
jgi:hypothetical protein